MIAMIEARRYPIDSIMITTSEELLFECEFPPFRRGDLHRLYSCTKSVVSLLVGLAVDRGLLDVETPLLDIFPEYGLGADPRRRRITLGQVLTMTWGLETRDDGDRWVGFEDSASDLLGSILNSPLTAEPGAAFRYNNGASHVLCCALRRATGIAPHDFARQELFGPLGIDRFLWDEDSQAGSTGWSGLSLAASDTAKLGQLVLAKGCWRGKRVLSERWLVASMQPHVTASPHGAYGYHWWIAPEMSMAVGIFGQCLAVAERAGLVVVINSAMRAGDTNFPCELVSRFVLPAWLDDPQPRSSATSSLIRASRSYGIGRHIWRSADEGTLRDGRFVRSTTPAFHFDCPHRARPVALSEPHRVCALHSAQDFPVFASVLPAVNARDLDGAVERYLEGLRRLEDASQVTLLESEPILLADGARARRAVFSYSWRPRIAMKAALIVAHHDGHWIQLEAHEPVGLEGLEPFLRTLCLGLPS